MPSEAAAPGAPWRLEGRWLAVLGTAAADAVRSRVAGAATVAGLAGTALVVGHYGPGSTLEYDEFIAVALARGPRGIAPRVASIGVNDRTAALGGRVTWGLAKRDLAFEWVTPSVVRVLDAGEVALTLRLEAWSPPVRVRRRARVASQDGREFLVNASGTARLAFAWVRARDAVARDLEPRRVALGVTFDGVAIVHAPGAPA